MEPVEPLAKPPDDGGLVEWLMPEFCALTIDGAMESVMETIRKDPERPPPPQETEVVSLDSRPSSTKRHRLAVSRSPYRNILQVVFQQCWQDVVEEAHTRN